MLLLSRKKLEAIIVRVGRTKITLRVVGVHGTYARIGVDAPEDVEVNREEIDIRKQLELKRERTQQLLGLGK